MRKKSKKSGFMDQKCPPPYYMYVMGFMDDSELEGPQNVNRTDSIRTERSLLWQTPR